MSLRWLFSFSPDNRRRILLLSGFHLGFSIILLGFWAAGRSLGSGSPGWVMLFILLQLWFAAQLLRPGLLPEPEPRSRKFYLFWAGILILAIWGSSQFSRLDGRIPLLTAFSSGVLLLSGTLIGTALARYIRRLWEILPLCLVMMVADFSSWHSGPTAGFARDIQGYYRAPDGSPPLIDMVLVKFAYPGFAGLAPVCGISDWIVVALLTEVMRRYRFDHRLRVRPPAENGPAKRLCRCLPLPVAALGAALLLAQISGQFIPALPLIALVTLLWLGSQTWLRKAVK